MSNEDNTANWRLTMSLYCLAGHYCTLIHWGLDELGAIQGGPKSEKTAFCLL